MKLIPSGDMLQVLATFSAVGFAISFGMPTLLSSRWSLMRQASTLERLLDFHVRFIGIFADPRVFILALSLGLLSIFSGILLIVYYLTCLTQAIDLALWIELAVMTGIIILILAVCVAASRVSRAEISKVLEYIKGTTAQTNKDTQRRKKRRK